MIPDVVEEGSQLLAVLGTELVQHIWLDRALVFPRLENLVVDTQLIPQAREEQTLRGQARQSDSPLRIQEERVGDAGEVVRPLRIVVGIRDDELVGRLERLQLLADGFQRGETGGEVAGIQVNPGDVRIHSRIPDSLDDICDTQLFLRVAEEKFQRVILCLLD